MAEQKPAVTVVPAVVIHPGDRVLLNFSTTEPSQVYRVMTELRERWPDVDFVAVGGAEVRVLPASQKEETDG